MNSLNTFQRGVTLIEIMVVLGVAAIVSATAVPAMNRFVVNNELRNAQQDVATVLRKAKNLARNQSSNISVVFDKNSNKVKLFRSTNSTAFSTISLENVTTSFMPVTVIKKTFVFLSMGTVDPGTSGEIILTSKSNSKRSKKVTVASLFGQITLD